MLDLSQTLEQVNLTDVYRTFHPATEEYRFFSRAHGPFLSLDHRKVTNKLEKMKGD